MRHIVIAGTVLAIAALCLPGCSSSRSKQRVTAAQPAAAASVATNSDHYRQALAAWQEWQATDGCSGPERNAFIAAIGRLKDDAAGWSAAEMDPPREGRMARERHATMALAFADEAMVRGCHADAERMFRHVFEFYPGSAHASIRERAQLGMEEARAARGVAEAKPE